MLKQILVCVLLGMCLVLGWQGARWYYRRPLAPPPVPQPRPWYEREEAFLLERYRNNFWDDYRDSMPEAARHVWETRLYRTAGYHDVPVMPYARQ